MCYIHIYIDFYLQIFFFIDEYIISTVYSIYKNHTKRSSFPVHSFWTVVLTAAPAVSLKVYEQQELTSENLWTSWVSVPTRLQL